MYFRFMVHYCSRPDVLFHRLRKRFLYYRCHHKQFPSTQLTQKSKHNNSAFKKWIKILAGENSSEAITGPRTEIPSEQQRGSPRRHTATCKPRSRDNIAFPSEEEAIQKTTEKRLQRLEKCTDSCDCDIFSLPLYSIQFNSFWIPQLQCERSRWREGTADASRKCRQQDSHESDQERQCIPGSLQSKFSLGSSMQLHRQQELNDL